MSTVLPLPLLPTMPWIFLPQTVQTRLKPFHLQRFGYMLHADGD
jgi:hypothetical protein